MIPESFLELDGDDRTDREDISGHKGDDIESIG
jgi:hypothetical protein